MDGGGRLAEPLKRARPGSGAKTRALHSAARERRHHLRRFAQFVAHYTTALAGRTLHRALQPLANLRLPRGAGITAATLLIGASLIYGSVAGGHWSVFTAELAGLRDDVANTAGFRITSVTLTGQQQISRESVLASAGITDRTSLLFLDAEAARKKLKANPWIADATVLKLYPNRLQVGITERQAFAVWQKSGRLSVIAEYGTVLEPYVSGRFRGLPLVVGSGAQDRAKEFLALIARYPEIRDSVIASVLVAQRRWNLRLKNGIDIRLPEHEADKALATLIALDREKKLLSRDIAAVDLRLPDRVTVRLSDEAAQAREEAQKPKKKKGGSA